MISEITGFDTQPVSVNSKMTIARCMAGPPWSRCLGVTVRLFAPQARSTVSHHDRKNVAASVAVHNPGLVVHVAALPSRRAFSATAAVLDDILSGAGGQTKFANLCIGGNGRDDDAEREHESDEVPHSFLHPASVEGQVCTPIESESRLEVSAGVTRRLVAVVPRGAALVVEAGAAPAVRTYFVHVRKEQLVQAVTEAESRDKTRGWLASRNALLDCADRTVADLTASMTRA